MFNELLKNVMNLGIITEDDVKRLTAIELMMLIIERINGLLLHVNNVDGKLDTLLEDVNKITIEELNKWTQDGTFDKLINELALKTVNDRIDETNAQLSQVNGVKVGNGVLASMSDLGQDIKEAMVGGSSNIPVVGAGSVNNVNINTHQITPDKLTDTVTINVSDLPVVHENKLLQSDGLIVDSTKFDIVEYVVPNEIIGVEFTGTSNLSPNGFIVYNDNSREPITFSKRNPHNCKIQLNVSKVNNEGVKKLILNSHTKGQISENEFDVIGADNMYDGTGYITNNNIVKTPAYSVYKVKILDNFNYKVKLQATSDLLGCVYNSSGEFLRNISVKNGYITKNNDMDYILINIAHGDRVIAERIEYKLQTGIVDNRVIKSHQITPDKLTDTVTINMFDLPVVQEDKVVTLDGSFVDGKGCKIVEYVMPNEMRSVEFVGTSKLTPNGIVLYDDGTTSEIKFGKHCPHNCKLLINYFENDDRGVKKLILKTHTKGQITENEFDVIGADNMYDGTGYISNDVVTKTTVYSIYKVKILNNFKYKATLQALSSLLGCAYDSSNNFLGKISLENGYIKKVANMDYILINITEGDRLIAVREEDITIVAPSNYISNHLNKPYNFNGKKAYFFGDSITRGFIDGSQITENGYPKLFSEKVGMTYSNFGIGGALFTSGYNEIETIPTTIKKKNYNDVDYVFIAGGTNDYGLGASLSEVRTTLVDLCAWLKENASTTEIIFILPINRVRDADVKKAELQDYRNIIGEIAIMNGFSVLDGSLFNFPTDDGELQKLLMPDKIHPSEFGYSVYVKGMCTHLC